jgi:hypothetical protein
MRRLAVGSALLGGAAILAACPRSAALSDAQEADVDAWLTCDECLDAELAGVVALGTDARTEVATVDRLGAALIGPDSGQRDNLRLQFAASYRAVPAPRTPEIAYVESFLANYVAVYQKRAATALGAIDTNRARDELREALARDSAGQVPLRPDVRRTVEAEIARSTTQAFQGTLTPSFAGALDTIVVTPGQPGAFDGDEDVIISGAPFPDDVLVSSTPTALRFVAAAEVGSYTVTITGLNAGPGEQAARLNLTSVAYEPQAPVAAPDLGSGPLPARRFTALTSHIDSLTGQPILHSVTRVALGAPVDHYRLTPATDTTAIARLEWRPGSTLAAHWFACDDLLAPPTSITLLVVDTNLDPVEGAMVELTRAGTANVVSQLTGPDGVVRYDGLISGADYTASAQMVGFGARKARVQPGQVGGLLILAGGPVRPASADTVSTPIGAGECRMLRVVKTDSGKGLVVGRVVVELARPVANIVITPTELALSPGEEAPLTVELQATDGTALGGRAVRWWSDNPAVATVAPDGTVTALGSGVGTVFATVEGRTAGVDVTVQ